MRISSAGTVAALAATVSAFADTAPFAIFASEDVSASFRAFGDLKKPIVDAADLPKFNCPNVDHVLILTHPGVNVADFQGSNFSPLKKALKSAKYLLQVPEVTGEYDADALYYKFGKDCGHAMLNEGEALPSEMKTVVHVELTPLESKSSGEKERKFALAKDDTTFLNLLPKYEGKSYMVLYSGIAAPIDSFYAEAKAKAKVDPSRLRPVSDEEGNPFGNEDGILKRPYIFDGVTDSFKIQSRSDKQKNGTMSDHRPLFEKYQFFTPGLFMGLLVTLLLLSILFVALRAISSLEVSYAAFEKEMGPQKGGKNQ